MLVVNNVKKVYGSRNRVQTEALTKVNFELNTGEFVAVMGESGSGKTTLLNLLATFDKPTAGSISLDGVDFAAINERDLASFRRNKLGFVFQDFSLLDTFNNKDNILLPLVLNECKLDEMEKRLKPLVEMLGLQEILLKFPYEISGGQKQRVAIARAMVAGPDLLLADEPTGALDSKSARNVMDVFADLNRNGQTILMVTHSAKWAAYASRVLFIKDGTVYHELYRGEQTPQAFMEGINDALALLSRKGGVL